MDNLRKVQDFLPVEDPCITYPYAEENVVLYLREKGIYVNAVLQVNSRAFSIRNTVTNGTTTMYEIFVRHVMPYVHLNEGYVFGIEASNA